MRSKNFQLQAILLIIWIAIFTKNSINASIAAEPDFLKYLQSQGLNARGWIASGITYQTENSNTQNNLPITFNDQSGVIQLNQANLFIEHAIDRDSKHWNVGGRFDLLFGTDSRFTQATGLDDKLLNPQNMGYYDLAIPQAYLEIMVPYANGVTAKIGHFYTIIGHEVVTAPNNFFYSHSYSMQYGEPFTHSGILLNAPLNENLTLNAGAVTGWDNFSKNYANWHYLGNVSWTNNAATNTISWSIISGETDNLNSSNRTLSSLVISHSFSDKFRYVFQHDFAVQQNAISNHATATWYSINQYLFYDLTEKVSLGLRGEWFCDNNGTRLNIGKPGNYVELTSGLNWKVLNWLIFRPELRFDYSDSAIKSYVNHTQNQQFATALDILITF